MKLSKLCRESIYLSLKSKLSYIGFATILGLLPTFKTIAQSDTTVLFQPPPEEEQPESTEGAASRQNRMCPSDSMTSQKPRRDRLALTAIVPQRNYGLTTEKRPTLWVYLPQTSAKKAILSIGQKGNTPHWQQQVTLTENVGVTGIKLSDDAPILEIGQNYQWAVILVCGERPNPNDPVVTAWIKRVEVAKNDDTAFSTPTEKAAIAAQEGIWYDALNTLVSEKSSLTNWQDLWVEYLRSGGLHKITNEPLIK